MHSEDCNCDECWAELEREAFTGKELDELAAGMKRGKQTKKVSKQYGGPPRTTDRHRKPGVKDYKNEEYICLPGSPDMLPPLTGSPYEEDLEQMQPSGAVGEAQPREHRLPEARPR